MTARHFRALATSISTLDLSTNDKEHVAEEIAKVCSSFNSAFKNDVFMHWSRGYRASPMDSQP